MQDLATRRLRWLNSKDGGQMTQKALAHQLETTQGGVSTFITQGVRSRQTAALIGYIFRDRCAALGLDAAAVDASLDTDDSHAFAA